MRSYGRIITELAIARSCRWQCDAEGDAEGCREFSRQEHALLAELESGLAQPAYAAEGMNS